MASRTTRWSGSRRSVASRGSKESGSPPSRRATSMRVRWHSSPLWRDISSRIWRAVSRLCASPGRARYAASGAHGKISTVSKFCEKREGINVGVVNEVEHGFGSYTVVGVFQQGLDGWEYGLIAGGGENRDGFLADCGRGMVQETANHGVSSALALDFEEAERVENFFRVGGKDFAGQEIRRGAVQRQRRGLV